MSTLIGPDELIEHIEDPSDNSPNPKAFIINGNKARCVEGIKYDFLFSGRFLKAKHGKAVEIDDFSRSDDTQVEPGETVFVLTKEILRLPGDIKAELSNKRKLTHEGVILLGGFCVDPLYAGPLVFGIYNISSQPFQLDKDRKLVAAQFYRLSPQECTDLPTPKTLTDFPRELRHIIPHLHGTSNTSLKRQVEDVKLLVDTLRDDFEKRERWFGDFKESLEAIKGILAQERQERVEGHAQMTKLFEEQTKNLKELNDAKITLEKATEKHALILGIAKWAVLIFLGFVMLDFFKDVFN